jgi:hypothetical protein
VPRLLATTFAHTRRVEQPGLWRRGPASVGLQRSLACRERSRYRIGDHRRWGRRRRELMQNRMQSDRWRVGDPRLDDPISAASRATSLRVPASLPDLTGVRSRINTIWHMDATNASPRRLAAYPACFAICLPVAGNVGASFGSKSSLAGKGHPVRRAAAPR